MAIGVNPVLVSEAGPIMAKTMGLSWKDDRAEVIEYLNKYRQLLYSMYSKFHLFDDVFHCINIERFCQPCVNDCAGGEYFGFTLPNDVSGAEVVYRYGFPLTLHSRWRESHTGIGVDTTTGHIAAVLMAEQFPTERDITTVGRLRVGAEHVDDTGKVMYVEGLDASGGRVKVRFTLVGDGFAVSRVKFSRVLSVTLPPERKGSVTLMDAGRKVLSIYTPCESVPVYRRMKVPEGCGCQTVLVQGNKKFYRIYFDNDIVEVGNQLIIEAAGRWFKYGETTTETKELQRATFDRAEIGNLLAGDVSRQQGAAKQDGFPYSRKTSRRKTLTGYSR